MYFSSVSPDPFIPEQHALDIAYHVRLHMARQKFVKDPEFAGFLRTDIDPGELELFAKPVQHIDICLVGENRGDIDLIYLSARGLVEFLGPEGPECNRDSCALRG